MNLRPLYPLLFAVCSASCHEEPCATFPRHFRNVEFGLQDKAFISIPLDDERKYDSKIKQCGRLLDQRIVGETLLNRRVVRESGRVMLRYIPTFVTDTTYYFQVGPTGEIVAAYNSRY